MAGGLFDDIPQESGIRLGRIGRRPTLISAMDAAEASEGAHLFGNSACRPERAYLLSFASLVRSAAT